jgi:UDP-N-acetylglucosamine 4,6-dehydratase/5-epimerase
MINDIINNKNILITGGSGSFGKHFAKTVLQNFEPKKVIIFSRDELKQFNMQNSSEFMGFADKLRYFLGDVRDLPRLKTAMQGVDIVIHTAALKHVTATEYNPFEAVKTNIIGGQNVIDSSLECGVSKVIALSTDKAAAPINLYGATKLASDKLFVAANNYKGKHDITLSVVRYGNVMGSSGSVIPLFFKKKKEGIIPITDPHMTRFNITIQEGVDFVLNCFEKMWGGEIFVPKIPSYNILDLAKAIAPGCKQKIVGIRHGEKLHEEMITESDAMNTIEFKDYYVIVPSIRVWSKTKFQNQSNGKVGKPCAEGFSYNSKSNRHFLSVKEIRDLININDL